MTARQGITTIALALVAAAAAIGFTAAAGEEEVQISIDQVPPAVRTTIEVNLAGGTITEIERSAGAERVVYEVEVTGPGGRFELAVAEDGTLLAVEADDGAQTAVIPLGKAPAAVRSAFRNVAGGAPAARVEQLVRDGRSVYEIEFQHGGALATVAMSERGDVMELELPVPAADLPEAVLAAMQQAFPGATIVEAESVQVSYFEIDIEQNGIKREIVVLANGRIGDDDGDDDEGEDDDADDEGEGDDDGEGGDDD